MLCCSSRPRRRPPSLAPHSPTEGDKGSPVSPVRDGGRRLYVGQEVAMLAEADAHQAYAAHPWRHPINGQSLAELSWEREVRPRCGSRGVVVGVDYSNDFVFVRFRPTPCSTAVVSGPAGRPPGGGGSGNCSSMSAFYCGGQEPDLAASYLLVGQLLVPQALRTLEWAALEPVNLAALTQLGCTEATWAGGAFFLEDPSCLLEAWDDPKHQAAAITVVDGFGDLNGSRRSGAQTAWDAWVEQRIDAACRAMRRSGWLSCPWDQLDSPLRGAATALGLSQPDWPLQWLSIAELHVCQQLRIADALILRAVCRAHPLWQRRFARQLPALLAMASLPCTVTGLEPSRQLVTVSLVSKTGQPGQAEQTLSGPLRLPPQALVTTSNQNTH